MASSSLVKVGDKSLHVGQRLSFDGQRCTLRYVGEIHGQSGDWLGVEWDDTTRGKNNGTHHDRKYFDCLSNSLTAASFIRPGRKPDESTTFLNALKAKYAGEVNSHPALSEANIKISGKTVEEIGFERIHQQQSALNSLQVIVLDGANINSAPIPSDDSWGMQIIDQGLLCHELDLSRNLLERWSIIVGICSCMSNLRSLKLDGNIFEDFCLWENPRDKQPFSKVTNLSFCAAYLTWDFIIQLLVGFPLLAHLNLSSNRLGPLFGSLPTTHLCVLDLSVNGVNSMEDLTPLASLKRLQKLSLRVNPVMNLSCSESFAALKSLDLKSTNVSNLSMLDQIPKVFPSLTSLITSNTPMANHPSAKLLTIARVPTLQELNYEPISGLERQSAELYYLNTVAKQLAEADPKESGQIYSEHAQWTRLCSIHGEPHINRDKPENAKEGTLAERVTTFTFYLDLEAWKSAREQVQGYPMLAEPVFKTINLQDVVEQTRMIPRTVNIYRLKGIIGQLFGIRPMSCRLIWETGEWDPVGQEDEGWSVSEDESDDDDDDSRRKKDREREQGKWEQRETELMDGTREVGFWIEDKKARIRVLLR